MNAGFLYIKSLDRIIPLDEIVSIEFTENGADDEGDLLQIVCSSETEDAELTGKEAEEAYIELIKKLPNLITIGN